MFFGIRDPGWEKIRIRDKHPGSATLQKSQCRSKSMNLANNGEQNISKGIFQIVILK